MVGEEFGDVNPLLNEGKAYVFNVDGTLIQTLSAPDPTPRGAFGLAVDIDGEVIAVGECWATVEGEPNSGKLHLYALGTPSTNIEQTTETSTVAETEEEQSTSGGIPGFPFGSIVIGLEAVAIMLWLSQRRQ